MITAGSPAYGQQQHQQQQVVVASLERQREQLTADIRKSCNEFLNDSDWDKNFAVVDQLNRMPYLCPFAIQEIRTQLKTKNPEIEILALMLTETVVKNCPSSHAAVAQPEFMRYLVKVALNQRKDGKFKAIGKKLTFKKNTVIDSNHKRSQCIDKALLLLQMLALAYSDSHLYPIFRQTYHKLQSQGVRFPKPNKDEDMQVFTPIHSNVNANHKNQNQNQNQAPGQGQGQGALSSGNGKSSSAMGSIPGLHLLPMIRPMGAVAGIQHPQLVSAQETAKILWEITNSCEDGDRMFGNEIISTLIQTLEAQQQTLVMMASDPSTTETALMQSLQVNDVANCVLEDVRAIQTGTKRRFREETKLHHVFPSHELTKSQLNERDAELAVAEVEAETEAEEKTNGDNLVLEKPKPNEKRFSRKKSRKSIDEPINLLPMEIPDDAKQPTNNNNNNNNNNGNDNNNGNGNDENILSFLGISNDNDNNNNGNSKSGHTVSVSMFNDQLPLQSTVTKNTSSHTATKSVNDVDLFASFSDPFASNSDVQPQPQPQQTQPQVQVQTQVVPAPAQVPTAIVNDNDNPFDVLDDPFSNMPAADANNNNNNNNQIADDDNPFDFLDDLPSTTDNTAATDQPFLAERNPFDDL